MHKPGEGPQRESATEEGLTGTLVGLSVGLALCGLLLLAPKSWLQGWWCLLWLTVTLVGCVVFLFRTQPDLLRRRGRVGAGTPAWDLALLANLGGGFLSELALAGLSHQATPWKWWWAGAALNLLGGALILRAVSVNRFFETTVRLQNDQGQRVVDRDVYSAVRHPGYAGGILWLASLPLMLGSAAALLGLAICTTSLAARTLLEEQFLAAHLEGYSDYIRRVRWRWCPGIW